MAGGEAATDQGQDQTRGAAQTAARPGRQIETGNSKGMHVGVVGGLS